nr:hypothetical protein [Enterococcus sp. 12C11_DIV0727]OTO70153.1 hypothetical protein A5866_002373 [Enterococcus sp. 12C11_DIV0727]
MVNTTDHLGNITLIYLLFPVSYTHLTLPTKMCIRDRIVAVAGMAVVPFLHNMVNTTDHLGNITLIYLLFPVSYTHLDVYKRQL